MTNIVSQITEKLFKFKNMSDIKYPEFLNTKEEYDECVRNILTVKNFEDVFHKLLKDDTLPMVDCLKIMAKLEHDTITTHGNNDVSCIMDMAEAIINYHYITSKETVLREKSNENKTCKTLHVIVDYAVQVRQTLNKKKKKKVALSLTLEQDVIPAKK